MRWIARLTFILLRGVGLTPLRPLPPPLLTSASSLPICIIVPMRTDSRWSYDPENAMRNHARYAHTYRSRGRSLTLKVCGLRSRLHLSSTFHDFKCSQDQDGCLLRNRNTVSPSLSLSLSLSLSSAQSYLLISIVSIIDTRLRYVNVASESHGVASF